MAINTGVNASIFINKVGYYIPLVIKIYYNLNDIIGPNVLNIIEMGEISVATEAIQ